MSEIRSRFRVLLALKEERDGRKYTYADISDATGLSTTTITSYSKNRVTRYDASSLMALCDFLECDLSDLLEYPPVPGQQNAAPVMA